MSTENKVNLNEMTATQMREYAAEKNIEIPGTVRKTEDIREFIQKTEANVSGKVNLDTKHHELSLEELQDLALEREFTLSGDESKEKLIEMLTGETQIAQNKDNQSETAVRKPNLTQKKGTIPEAEKVGTETLPGVIMNKEFYKEYFEKLPKVRVIIPLGMGEARSSKDSNGKTVYPYENVSINGYTISVRKGVYLNVPEPFAQIIESYINFQVENQFDLGGADDDTIEALS